MSDIVLQRHPVYLIRHGRTALNAEGRFQGLIDEPLDEQGRAQAKALGAKLAGLVGGKIAAEIELHTSPLIRAAQTMEFVAKALGRDQGEVIETGALREMSLGRWEGMTTLEVKEKYPDERRQRKLDRWNFSPGGGESYAALAERVQTWLQALEKPVVAVTHLGVMRVAAVITGAHDRETAMKLVPGDTEIWCMSHSGLNRL